MKSYRRNIICFIVLVFLLLGCGGGGGGTTQSPKATPTEVSVTTSIPTALDSETCLADLPIYPGSQEAPEKRSDLEELVIQMESMGQVSGGEVDVYITSDVPSKVVTFYQGNPLQEPWNRTMNLTSEEGGIIVWENGDFSAQMFVGVEQNETVILLGCGPKLGSAAAPHLPTYTTADGLVDNSVIAVAVGPDGSIWFATLSGLSRFDGTRWTTYTHDNGLPGPTYIYVVVPEAADSIWIGTRDFGVAHFDGNSWKNYTRQDGLLSDKVSSLVLAPDGTLWASSSDIGGGVSHFDGHNWTTYKMRDGLSNNWVVALAVASDGIVWAGMEDSVVAKFDGTAWTNYTTTDGLVDDAISAIAVDQTGGVWIGTDGGVSHFDGQIWTTYTKDDGLVSSEVSAIAVASDNSIWFGTQGSGVSHLKADGTWENYTDRDGLPSNWVTSLSVAPDGRIWVGTDFSGVAVITPPE
jgi:ligand-binding sensor domain-containing protein